MSNDIEGENGRFAEDMASKARSLVRRRPQKAEAPPRMPSAGRRPVKERRVSATATRLDRDRPDAAGPAAIDYGMLVELVGFWVRRANIHVLRSFGGHLGDLELRPVEVATLILLRNNAGLSQIALAGALGTDQSTLVGLLARLEQRKLIDRRRLATDRRFHEVHLTRAGQTLAKKVEQRLAEHNADLLAPLAAEERKVLISLLRRLVALNAIRGEE